MGIDIRWENEFGVQLEEVSDPKDYFGLSLSASRLDKTICLRFIDPYGNTVFNQAQIPVFIGELQVLRNLVSQKHIADSINAIEHLDKILELAQRSHDKTHTYLKFYGD